MLPPFRAYLDALRQFPFSVLEQPQHYFRRPGRDFTRRHSLYLERGELKDYLKDYYRQILQTLEPERPGKNKERRRRILRGTERHNHEKNYRRAF